MYLLLWPRIGSYGYEVEQPVRNPASGKESRLRHQSCGRPSIAQQLCVRNRLTTPEEWQADSGLAERNPALDGDSRSD